MVSINRYSHRNLRMSTDSEYLRLEEAVRPDRSKITKARASRCQERTQTSQVVAEYKASTSRTLNHKLIIA
jgi:DNA-binding protein H-NS